MKKAFTISVWLALFAGLVALTTFAAMEIDHALTTKVEALKTGTMDAVERITGRSVTYGEISPSFFRSINVRDITIHDSSDPGRTLLVLHEVRVFYNLFQLLAGRDPLSAIREIRLLNSRITVDLEKDSDVVELVKRLVETGGAGGLRARVTGADIGLTVTSRDSTLDLQHVFFQVDAQSQSIAVSLRGDAAGRLPGGFDFASSLKAQGSLDRSLTGSDVTIRLLSLTSSFVNTSAQTLQLVWKGSTIDIRKIQDRSPIALEMQGDLQKREFTLNFTSQDMRLDRLFTLSRSFSRYSSWLKVPLTASGHITYRARTNSLEYEADASAFLEDQLPMNNVTLTTSMRGTEKEAFFQPLRLSASDGTAEFEGSVLFSNLYPSGQLSLADVDIGNGEKVNANFGIDRLSGSLLVSSSHLQIGELSFDAFHLTLSPSAAGAVFAISTSFAGTASDDLLQAIGELRFRQPPGKTVGNGPASATATAPGVNVSVSLKNLPPAKLYHLVIGAGKLSPDQQEVYAFLGHYSVSTEAVVTSDFTHLSLAARSVTVTSNEDPATGFHFGLAVDKSHLSLTGFTGAWKGTSISGGFEGDLGDGGQIGFASNLALLGNSYFVTGRYSRSAGLTATGTFGLAVSAIPVRGGGALVKLKADKFPLPLQGMSMPASFDISGLVTPEGEWSASFPSITFFDVPLPPGSHATVQLSGRITPRVLDIMHMSVSDSSATLVGSAHVAMVLPTDVFDPRFFHTIRLNGSASLKAPDGMESYSTSGGLEKGALAIAVRFEGLPPSRIGVRAVLGTFSGSGNVTGTVEEPSADVALSLKQGKLGTDPLLLDGRLMLGKDGIQLQSVSAAYLAHKLSGGEGTVDPRKGTFKFSGLFQTEVFADSIAVDLGLEGSYSTTGGASSLGTGLFDVGLQARVSLNNIKVAGTGLPSWGLSLRTVDRKISFDGGPGNSIHGWIDPQLSFNTVFRDPLPITGNIDGKITQDRIHAVCTVTSFNLQTLNPILKSPSVDMGAGPAPVIHFSAGGGIGKLVVDGEINDPDFTGRLDIFSGGILTAYSPDVAGPITTSLVFDGKGFHTPKIHASAGAARLSATASFTIDHWIPQTWDLSLSTESASSARVRGKFGRLNAEGSASGAIRVSGDDRKTSLDGSIVVSDCRITLGQAPDGKFVPEESPTYANLSVTTGRRVEFQWPSKDLPVIQTTAIPGGRIVVTYRGDTGAYTVKGVTSVQGGEIYYFERSFIMRRGSITFNEDQTTFDPWITARAEVREWDPSTGAEVRIYLDADSRFSKFSPRFSSDPPRASSDILAMIGAPIANRVETQGVGMAAIMYSDILGQNWILRPFEQKVRQTLNLDMFSFRTQIVQNLLAQKAFGMTTLNPLDNTSVSLGKYLGRDLFLELLVTLQQPQFPVGVVTSGGGLVPATTAIQPNVELNLEWATPFFLLEWSFLPQHPETLFLSDNSLSFSWRYSY